MASSSIVWLFLGVVALVCVSANAYHPPTRNSDGVWSDQCADNSWRSVSARPLRDWSSAEWRTALKRNLHLYDDYLHPGVNQFDVDELHESYKRDVVVVGASMDPDIVLRMDAVWFAHFSGFGVRANMHRARFWHAQALKWNTPLAATYDARNLNGYWLNSTYVDEPQAHKKLLFALDIFCPLARDPEVTSSWPAFVCGMIHYELEDFKLARLYYGRAIEHRDQPHFIAMNHLGVMEERGDGKATFDEDKAYSLFERSARMGFTQAMGNVARLLFFGASAIDASPTEPELLRLPSGESDSAHEARGHDSSVSSQKDDSTSGSADDQSLSDEHKSGKQVTLFREDWDAASYWCDQARDQSDIVGCHCVCQKIRTRISERESARLSLDEQRRFQVDSFAANGTDSRTFEALYDGLFSLTDVPSTL